jgi:hypothetical protein
VIRNKSKVPKFGTGRLAEGASQRTFRYRVGDRRRAGVKLRSLRNDLEMMVSEFGSASLRSRVEESGDRSTLCYRCRRGGGGSRRRGALRRVLWRSPSRTRKSLPTAGDSFVFSTKDDAVCA